MTVCGSEHQDDEDEDGGGDSELDESESEAEAGAEQEKQRVQKDEEDNEAAASQKYVTTPDVAPSGIKGHQKTQARSAEEVRDTITRVLCKCLDDA